jgi:hypothetical protein
MHAVRAGPVLARLCMRSAEAPLQLDQPQVTTAALIHARKAKGGRALCWAQSNKYDADNAI